MIEVDGYKAFRGTMRITPANPDKEPFEANSEWLYRPDTDCWYGRERYRIISSFPAKMCKVVEDETA